MAGVLVTAVIVGGEAALRTRLAETAEEQPKLLITMKVYVPGATPVYVVLTPVPVFVTLPGLRINVQVPVAGKPSIANVPVVTTQLG